MEHTWCHTPLLLKDLTQLWSNMPVMIPLEGNFSVKPPNTCIMSTVSYFMLSLSLLRFHAIPSHSGRSHKDVLNKEELLSQERSVHTPQTVANGCGVAPETVTTVRTNAQNCEFEILLTFACQYL